MRVRALSASGDMTFGQGSANFFIDNVAAVAQNVDTRLGLITGEWFLDVTEGTPWFTQVIGFNRSTTYDAAIRLRILDTYGVVSINNYASAAKNRKLTVNCDVDTVYGPTFSVNQSL